MERLLHGIPGVILYFNDVLVSGENKTELLDQLWTVLQRFQEAGLKVEKEKCNTAVT